MKKKIDIYKTVTDKIVAEIEKGALPWLPRWKKGQYAPVARPINAVSKKPYSSVNILLCWMAGEEHNFATQRWLTFKQAQAAGGHVRKGEKGTQITYFTMLAKEDDNGEEIEIPMTKAYTVFNVTQCEGLPESITGALNTKSGDTINGLDNTELLKWRSEFPGTLLHGGDRAFFSPSGDFVQMPEAEKFHSESGYWATLFHELTHWSGGEKRLNREFGKRFGDNAYAMEELVAELGAAFMCADLSVTGELRHSGYLDNWLKVLKADKKAIFTAASKASKAVDFLLSSRESAQMAA